MPAPELLGVQPPGRAGEEPEGAGGSALLRAAGVNAVLEARTADVGASRERLRLRRLGILAAALGPIGAYLWFRVLSGNPVGVPSMPEIDWLLVTPIIFFVLLIALLVGTSAVAGRSPHVLYRPEQIDVTMADVAGIGPVKDEAIRSINLFLAGTTFAQRMGGSPRRGLLFEGPPGTGKTHLAKAMAREAGVPFLFVSATSFQSMYYGATSRKIRSYFKALRKAARREGGAIGFIEEIDAIALARGGMSFSAPSGALSASVSRCGGLVGLPAKYAGVGDAAGPQISPSMVSEGVGGVVNELLVQMQSFDEPTGWQKARDKLTNSLNLYLPPHRQLRRSKPAASNVLLVAATNRADNLDPALLRPGRFDRRLTFSVPDKLGRRALLDAFLARKAHAPELDNDDRRDALAALTNGYTPARLQHLLDEALISAVRRGSEQMSWSDVEGARLVEDVGLGQPVGYTQNEKRVIATHEAGHATVAWLTAPHRRLEVLSIIKRGDALGMLAHGDREDVYTRSRAELTALVQISLGGQCAEELFFGDVSTGPSGDLLYATTAAAEMLGACGMGDSLISYAAVQSPALSGTNLVGRLLADPQGRAELERFLQEQRREVRLLVAEHRHLVAALRDALLDRHELLGTEITDVLESAASARPDGVVT